MTTTENDALVIRAGSSNRTGDELASVFIYDAGVLTATPEVIGDCYDSHNDPRIPDYVHVAMDDADSHGWCEDPDNSQTLSDFIAIAEGWLGERDMYAHWDDGVVIYNTTAWTDEDFENLR